MSPFRVTSGMLSGNILNSLSTQERQLLRIQEQLATGQIVNRPSDDPLATGRALEAQGVISRNTQYITNISTISPYLSGSETAIQTAEDLRQRAYELTLQGSSDTNGPTQLAEIAVEINSILEDMVDQANQSANGRYLFGGTHTTQEPFTVTRDANGEITSVSYQGNSNAIEIQVSDGVSVSTNEIGSTVFQTDSTGSVDIFQTLINIRDALRAGDSTALAGGLTDITQAQDQFTNALARIGATTNRIERINTTLSGINTDQEEVVSNNIDADYTKVAVQLNTVYNAYEASLNAASKIIQTSLLDYL